MLKEKNALKKMQSEARAVEREVKDRCRRQLDVSLDKAKIFPFCSVYNLFLLAKLKIK
jgi:hypothetical protein